MAYLVREDLTFNGNWERLCSKKMTSKLLKLPDFPLGEGYKYVGKNKKKIEYDIGTCWRVWLLSGDY